MYTWYPRGIGEGYFMLTPSAIILLSSINSETQKQNKLCLLSFQISALQTICSGRHFLWLFARQKQIHSLLYAVLNTTILKVVLLHANDSAY